MKMNIQIAYLSLVIGFVIAFFRVWPRAKDSNHVDSAHNDRVNAFIEFYSLVYLPLGEGLSCTRKKSTPSTHFLINLFRTNSPPLKIDKK